MSQTRANLRRLREHHKLSQTEISRRTGIPQPRLSRWEAGEMPGAADDALTLAALLADCDTKAARNARRAAKA